MSNYINDLRQKVGNAPLILNTATGALFNNAGEVLLQERVDTKDWGFPGGYLEYGETYKKAIMREFQEDTGLSVIPEKLIQNTDDTFYKYPNGDQIQSINQFF
ncbi:NUDIX domain-containing protein [Pediococcus pentosaceus]|nr:NUDIX domain-containing protein [Pediococcus pentosaceus]